MITYLVRNMDSECIYLAKDFNFNHYSVKDLDLICDYRLLPILTRISQNPFYLFIMRN